MKFTYQWNKLNLYELLQLCNVSRRTLLATLVVIPVAKSLHCGSAVQLGS